MKKSTKKTIKIIAESIAWVFVVCMAVLTIFAFAAKSKNADLPQLGDNYYFTVLSNSMKSDEGFSKGDVIIVKGVSFDEANNLEDGTVISFYAYDDEGNKIINSHRIISSTLEGNYRSYTTKGDNISVQDNATVESTEVLGVWTGKKIAGLGGFITFLQSVPGFIILIIVPMGAVFIIQLISLVQAINKYKNKGKVLITKEDEEEIKRKAIEEYLASQASSNPASTEEKEEK